jgi:predicted DNA-binding protein
MDIKNPKGKTIEVIFRTDAEMVDFLNKKSEETGEGKSAYLRGLIRKEMKKK